MRCTDENMVSFVHAGNYLISASFDKTLRVWSLNVSLTNPIPSLGYRFLLLCWIARDHLTTMFSLSTSSI